jgi:hypothetical protein
MSFLHPCRICGVQNDVDAAPTHCGACGQLLEPHPRATPFARLGVAPVRFGIEDAVLEAAWLRRSRLVHPDRFARKSDAERRVAAQQTAALNDAWRTIRTPFDRAVWLVTSLGVDEPGVKQATLLELMECREEAALSPAAQEAVVLRCRERFAEVMAMVVGELTAVDDVEGWSTPDERVRAHARRAAALLGEARMLARLVADLDGGLLVASLASR